MKRGGPLKRTSPLRSSASLTGGGSLARSPIARAAMKVSRPVVSPEERHARKVVTARSGGTCEGCRREPATDWAHRVARSQMGPWCPSNGLHLGRDCHAWAHANPVEARSVGWILRSGSDHLAAPALLPVVGWARLGVDGSITPIESEL